MDSTTGQTKATQLDGEDGFVTTTALVPVERDLSGLSLSQLAKLAVKHHETVALGARRTLEVAIQCGLVLAECRNRVAAGEWVDWCRDNIGLDRTVVAAYVRLATHRDLLTGGEGIQEAKEYLAAIGAPRLPFRRKFEYLLDEVKALQAEGLPLQQIDRKLDVPDGTSWRLLNRPRIIAYRKGLRARQTKAQKALEAQEQERQRRENIRLAKAAGVDVAHAYSCVRRLAQDLDRAIGASHNPSVRAALQDALNAAFKAEDNIVKALRS